ncbi:MAG: plasmid partitioning protein [Frankia sp.]|nr:plasmid partitioning protein [Frankia sp.]
MTGGNPGAGDRIPRVAGARPAADLSARRVGGRGATGRAGRGASSPGRRRAGGNPKWLPIVAATCIIGFLLWYALVQAPTKRSDEAPGASLAAAAAAADDPNADTDGDGVPDGGSTANAPAPYIPVPAGRSGCDTGAALPPGVSTQTVTVGQTTRTFLLGVPETGPQSGPLPLIVNFHNAGMPAADMEVYTGLAAEATKKGYVVATPVGENNQWNFIRSAEAGPDDVAFVDVLLNDLHTRGCLADDRVFATGLGTGADMAVAASCAMPGRIAAIVSVAGSVIPQDCPSPTTNLFEIHGTEDPISPWDGGGPPRPAPFDSVTAQPVLERLDRYAKAAGCDAAPVTQPLPGLGELTAWTCEGKPDVGVLAAAGGGHTWPQAPDSEGFGPTAKSFSATVVSLLYFQAHAVAGASAGGQPPALAELLAGG